MDMRTIQIGVLGCAQIVERALITPISQVSGLLVHGIASRGADKAKQYASHYHIPIAFESYEELLQCEDIELVYIALSNDLHKEWAVKAVQANKHVLLEKPLCLNLKEYAAIESANVGGKHILEALMVQHHPWQHSLRAMVEDNRYGRLLRTESAICIVPREDISQNYRSMPEKGGGSFHDLGCYWLQFLQKTTGLSARLNSFSGRSAFDGPNGCDMTFMAEMNREDGFHASLITSFERSYKASHTLFFEKAKVTVPDFFRASLGNYKITIKIERSDAVALEKMEFEPQSYYVNQLAFFRDVVAGHKPNIAISESYERIRLSQHIYQSAKEWRNANVHH
ncbi:Gfo/Idh/MocA family protein [Paenibacillus sinopodophylli]|uniref:Gfo/Idh/MocA family protein n=1 Tax=Paenibacillus sinopodophylli TaxID=1837342 RepID=UPI001FE676F7|nr:Gfo/Idh/MocA family oxidoreductase [Paenibacillus sinopodophylli]